MKTIIAAIIATTFAMGTAFAQSPVDMAQAKVATTVASAKTAATTAATTATTAATTAVAPATPSAPATAAIAAPASQAKATVPGEKSRMKHHMGTKKMEAKPAANVDAKVATKIAPKPQADKTAASK